MGIFTIKVPDVGEGIAEAELVEWDVSIGDVVLEDQTIAAVMTDKATVEIPSSVEGRIVWLGGKIGDTIAIGSDLVRIEVAGEGNEADSSMADQSADAIDEPLDPARATTTRPDHVHAPVVPASNNTQITTRPELQRQAPGEKPLASPSVRLRARDNGVDLHCIAGSGPAGIITHHDLDTYLDAVAQPSAPLERVARTAVNEVSIVGLRRKIAERMTLAKSRIPHITIIEEIDVTSLEELRTHLNAEKTDDASRLTFLPFLVGAIVKAVAEQPSFNAHFDDDAGVVKEYGAVHVGIAAQTPNGLMVPVVRHCEARSIRETAAEIARVSECAKAGTATREDLSGSTITISSLGALGAIATTPIINRPEVAIVGVNRMAVRPMWNGTDFVPRKMMNLSSSFDHRVIDGYDAAVFVKRLKTLLETPALIFIEA